MADRPYLALLRSLETAGVRYAIAGGVAAVLHGVPRMTFDLDLVVDLSEDNIHNLIAVMVSQGFHPRLPVSVFELADESKRNDWVNNRNLVAFTFIHPQRPMEEVDILLAPGVTWEDVSMSMTVRPINGDSVKVLGKALLRKMKLATGREKDKADAEFLED